MSKVKPTILAPNDPVLLDRAISDLQNAFSMSAWFNQGLLLPRADKDEKDEKPIVYWKGKEYYPAEPNDNYRVVSFFYQEDPATSVGQYGVRFTLNFVCWFNQYKYSRSAGYSIREFFISDLVNILRRKLANEDDGSISVFRETDQIFANYSLTDRTKFKFPYQAFRIRFTYSTVDDCPGKFVV